MFLRLTKSEWLKAIGMFLVSVPLEISSFIIAPFLFFFVNKETGHLPKWLSWYDEPNYGAWGDEEWKQSHFKESSNETWWAVASNKTWWAVTRWYWRNRTNGYQVAKQGLDVSKLIASTLKCEGDSYATNKKGSQDTYCVVRAENTSGKKFFSLYYEKQWGKKFYLRMYIGWKMMDISNAKNTTDLNKWIKSRQLEGKLHTLKPVFSINPFKIRRS